MDMSSDLLVSTVSQCQSVSRSYSHLAAVSQSVRLPGGYELLSIGKHSVILAAVSQSVGQSVSRAYLVDMSSDLLVSTVSYLLLSVSRTNLVDMSSDLLVSTCCAQSVSQSVSRSTW